MLDDVPHRLDANLACVNLAGMNRAWPWAILGSTTLLLGSILYSIHEHARFTEVLFRVLTASWG